MATRKAISKKLRFEVFKRDSFRCQYCGGEAPTVLLHVDHIKPVADGGKNDIANLIASCEPCNAGKGARPLSDASAVAKSKAQLDELQQRREQLELMMEWKRGLADLAEESMRHATTHFSESVPGYNITNAAAQMRLRKLIKTFGVSEVIESIDGSCDSYLKLEPSGEILRETANKVWSSVGAVCRVRRASKDAPDLKDLYYIRGILRKRLSYLNDWKAIAIMKQARSSGVPLRELREIACDCWSWTEFQERIEEAIQL